MRFLFISPYDERCAGLRSIGAVLAGAGHAVHFAHIEGFICQFVPAGETELAVKLLRENPLVARDPEALGDTFIGSQQKLGAGDLELLLGYVAELRPDAVGLSVWIGQEALCGQITAALQERFPALRVIWGGIYPTLFPEAAVESCPIICLGEGELALRQWAAEPGRTDVPGMWFREGGAVRRNALAPPPDLDELPFPLYRHNERTLTGGSWSLLQMDDAAHAGRNVMFSASRYCRFDCAYCLSGRMRRAGNPQSGSRRKSVDRFLDEIEHVGRICDLPGTLAFWDDNFAVELEWTREFAAQYPRRIGRPFTFNTHPSHTTREAVDLLCGAGARGIALGLQSGSARVLKEVYGRDPDIDKLIDLAHFIAGRGLVLQIDLITNNPFETEADCRATLETLLRLPKTADVHPSKLVLYPGSRLADFQGPKGGLTDRDFDFWNLLYLLAGSEELSGPELRALADDAELRKNPNNLMLLRKTAHAGARVRERVQEMQGTIEDLQGAIAARDHLLENSCHKKIGAIVRDKIRYRIERWRNPANGGRP